MNNCFQEQFLQVASIKSIDRVHWEVKLHCVFFLVYGGGRETMVHQEDQQLYLKILFSFTMFTLGSNLFDSPLTM